MAKPETGSPLWLLEENAESADKAARSFFLDHERYAIKAQEQRDKAAAFRAAADLIRAAQNGVTQ